MQEESHIDVDDKTFPLVSVVMLTYNHRPYIRQALDSVLEQKAPFSFEVLVGDDASTDGTSEIVREYAARYPKQVIGLVRPHNRSVFTLPGKLYCRLRGGRLLAGCAQVGKAGAFPGMPSGIYCV